MSIAMLNICHWCNNIFWWNI